MILAMLAALWLPTPTPEPINGMGAWEARVYAEEAHAVR